MISEMFEDLPCHLCLPTQEVAYQMRMRGVPEDLPLKCGGVCGGGPARTRPEIIRLIHEVLGLVGLDLRFNLMAHHNMRVRSRRNVSDGVWQQKIGSA